MSEAGERQRFAAGAAAALLVAATVAAAVTLAFSSRAEAKPEFLAAFGARYPGAAGSRIGSCLLCHRLVQEEDEIEYKMNPFGIAAKEAGFNFAAIEGLDSDGDGYSNLQEIAALTFPGNAADNPATVPTTTTLPGGVTTTAAPGSGGALYAANCASCHGANGGNLVPTGLSRSQLVSVISAGSGGMPGFAGRLSAGAIGSIADTLLSWSATPTTQAPGSTTATTNAGPVSGAAVYSSYCAGCHGAAGGNLASRGLSASRISSVTASGTAGMPSFRSTLSSAQISAVASYLASRGSTTTTTSGGGPVAPTAGGPALYSSYCSGCHGAAGGNLASRGLSASRVAAVTASGTAGMPSFGSTLGASEISAIAGYVASLGGGGSTTAATSSEPPATAGTEPEGSAPDGSSGAPPAGGSGDPVAPRWEALPGVHGETEDEGGGTWFEPVLAGVLALGAASGAGLLLVRSARRVFRT